MLLCFSSTVLCLSKSPLHRMFVSTVSSWYIMYVIVLECLVCICEVGSVVVCGLSYVTLSSFSGYLRWSVTFQWGRMSVYMAQAKSISWFTLGGKNRKWNRKEYLVSHSYLCNPTTCLDRCLLGGFLGLLSFSSFRGLLQNAKRFMYHTYRNTCFMFFASPNTYSLLVFSTNFHLLEVPIQFPES